MITYQNTHEIHIDRIDAAQTLRAGMITALCYRQKRSMMRENTYDMIDLRNTARAREELYTDTLKDPETLAFIARVPAFKTDLPLSPMDEYQDAGYIELYESPEELRIGWIHSVQSPYPTGSAMLGFAITYAMTHNMPKISLSAVYPESAKWFAENGNFGLYNPKWPMGQRLSLHARDFDTTLKTLEQRKELSFQAPLAPGF